MKAVIGTTLDDKYLYFLPITAWCWNKIGVEVICFMPESELFGDWIGTDTYSEKGKLIANAFKGRIQFYNCDETRHATYSQCARLYGACLDLPEDEVLITGDIDMCVFGDYLKQKAADFDIFGFDLCPPNQYPICYISATVKNWRSAMEINSRTYQQCLDNLLGGIEGEHIRGNYWAKDQETAFEKISKHNNIHLHGRAHPGTQFSTNRIDRDDAYWEDRLHPGIVDAHLWRPGYTEENFPKILKLLTTMYPNDNFDWLIEYTNKYRELL